MRNILKNKKAGTVPIALVVIILLIVAGVFLIVSSGTSTSYWETKNEFGGWQEEIIIGFEDGTTESLKMIEETQSLSVFYQGKAIEKVTWVISGIATGAGYDKAVVDRSGIRTNWAIKRASVVKDSGIIAMTGTVDLWVGGTAGTINRGEIDVKTKMDNNRAKYPDGFYVIEFVPSGIVNYWGEPDGGETKTASLPPDRSITLSVLNLPLGDIVVSLSSSISTS